MTESQKDGGRSQPRLDAAEVPALPSRGVKLIRSRELFADVREVVIEHEGEHYRLRATKKGKLILTK